MTAPVVVSNGIPLFITSTTSKAGVVSMTKEATIPVVEDANSVGVTADQLASLNDPANGVAVINWGAFVCLYKCIKGKFPDLAVIKALPTGTNVLGVDLAMSPHCVVVVSNPDNADGFDLCVVRSDNTEIIRPVKGAGKAKTTEYRFVVAEIIHSIERRGWSDKAADIPIAMSTHFAMFRKRLLANNKAIVVDFSGLDTITNDDVQGVRFLVAAMHRDIAPRVSYVGIPAPVLPTAVTSVV